MNPMYFIVFSACIMIGCGSKNSHLAHHIAPFYLHAQAAGEGYEDAVDAAENPKKSFS